MSRRRLCLALLSAIGPLLCAPLPASSATMRDAAAVRAVHASDASAVQHARVRRIRPRARRALTRRRPRIGSSSPYYPGPVRLGPALPSYSIMVPETVPPVRPGALARPATVLPPTGLVRRSTIVPPSVTPLPETSSDRIVRCTHSAGVNGLSIGQTGAYVSSCAF